MDNVRVTQGNPSSPAASEQTSPPGGPLPPTDSTHGLSSAEVAERVAQGQTNDVGESTSRSLSEIFRANVLTRFNAILGAVHHGDGDGVVG